MNDLSPEIDEYLEEYLTALQKQHYHQAIQVVERCYMFWVGNNTSPQSYAATMTSMLVFALSGELMWMSHYSLTTATGFVFLTLSIGILTTQNIGFFQCPTMKKKISIFQAKLRRSFV